MTRFKKSDLQNANKSTKRGRDFSRPNFKQPNNQPTKNIFSSREKTGKSNQIAGWINDDIPVSEINYHLSNQSSVQNKMRSLKTKETEPDRR